MKTRSLLTLGSTLGLFSAARATRQLLGRAEILTYHRIAPNTGDRPFLEPVDPRIFREHMEWATRTYEIVPLARLVDCLHLRQKWPRRSLVVTFDDGYKDVYTNAFPVLSELGIPATFFVTAGCIDKRERLWWDVVHRSFQGDSGAEIARLKQLNDEDRRRAVASRKELLSLGSGDPDDLVTWTELKDMAGHGIEIGSHTMSHPVLDNATPGTVAEEIGGAKAMLEERVGAPVQAFAYPAGSGIASVPVHRSLVTSGHRAAVTNRPRSNVYSADPYLISRRSVPNRDTTVLSAILAGALDVPGVSRLAAIGRDNRSL